MYCRSSGSGAGIPHAQAPQGRCYPSGDSTPTSYLPPTVHSPCCSPCQPLELPHCLCHDVTAEAKPSVWACGWWMDVHQRLHHPFLHIIRASQHQRVLESISHGQCMTTFDVLCEWLPHGAHAHQCLVAFVWRCRMLPCSLMCPPAHHLCRS